VGTLVVLVVHVFMSLKNMTTFALMPFGDALLVLKLAWDLHHWPLVSLC
jgi:hypothetical protein